ncbi:MAG: ABC transporter permease [Firmicutes bacterium]|nr:ABC transporter permease [Bacillota bacterium]
MSSLSWEAWIGVVLVTLLLLAGLLGPIVYPVDPLEQDLYRALEEPSPAHPCGTDELGRDLLARLLYGLNSTLFIALAGVLAGGWAGSLLGLSTGFTGGWWDYFCMRFTDILLAFPGFLLALSVAAILKNNHLNLIVAIAIFTIPGFARLTRARALELRTREYVTAAKALGNGSLATLYRHILPNSLPLIYTLTSQRLSAALLTTSGLSFLGLGPQPPLPELGAMLNTGREYMWVAPHLSILPGIVLSLCVLAFNLLGYGLKKSLKDNRH